MAILFLFPFESISNRNEGIIVIIDKYYNNIENNLSKYKKVNKFIYGLSDNGGKTISYYRDNELVKIKAFLYNQKGNIEYDFYFRNEENFYTKKIITNYNNPLYVKNYKKKIAKIFIYYFARGNLVKLMENDYEIKSFHKIEEAILNHNVEYAKIHKQINN